MSTIGITSSGNILTVNGKTARAVNSISGSVSNNNLRINVNGVSSGDIPLPDSTPKMIDVCLENLVHPDGTIFYRSGSCVISFGETNPYIKDKNVVFGISSSNNGFSISKYSDNDNRCEVYLNSDAKAWFEDNRSDVTGKIREIYRALDGSGDMKFYMIRGAQFILNHGLDLDYYLSYNGSSVDLSNFGLHEIYAETKYLVIPEYLVS